MNHPTRAATNTIPQATPIPTPALAPTVRLSDPLGLPKLCDLLLLGLEDGVVDEVGVTYTIPSANRWFADVRLRIPTSVVLTPISQWVTAAAVEDVNWDLQRNVGAISSVNVLTETQLNMYVVGQHV